MCRGGRGRREKEEGGDRGSNKFSLMFLRLEFEYENDCTLSSSCYLYFTLLYMDSDGRGMKNFIQHRHQECYNVQNHCIISESKCMYYRRVE